MGVSATMFKMVNVDFSYGSLEILRGFCLVAAENEFLCLFGPSGTGKTTILNLLAGIIAPTGGSVVMPECRKGYVFQEPRLLPWCDVMENIALGLHAFNTSATERHEAAADLVERLGLKGFERYFPAQMSGGMKQRVALGRAFAIRPDLLLPDEPFAALDENMKVAMRSLLLDLVEWRRCTTVFVTHDLSEAARMGDRIIVLGGRPCRVIREVVADVPRNKRTPSEIERLEKAVKEGMNGSGSPTLARKELEA